VLHAPEEPGIHGESQTQAPPPAPPRPRRFPPSPAPGCVTNPGRRPMRRRRFGARTRAAAGKPLLAPKLAASPPGLRRTFRAWASRRSGPLIASVQSVATHLDVRRSTTSTQRVVGWVFPPKAGGRSRTQDRGAARTRRLTIYFIVQETGPNRLAGVLLGDLQETEAKAQAASISRRSL